MIEIALTGNRFSGKDTVAQHFRRMGVPVFDGDAVLKFILNHRSYIDNNVKSNIGNHVYTNGFLDSSKIRGDIEFDRIIDIVEFELFNSFELYKRKCKSSYIIFSSSIIFERKYNDKFRCVINVFTPREERISRGKEILCMNHFSTSSLMNNEISEFAKNEKSDFVVHSYMNAPPLARQVREIDKKITKIILKDTK